MSPPTPPPEIRPLTHDECLAVLARHQVGRLAFTFHDRVDIQPIHYVYDDGWLYGRTSEGAKLETIAHNRWVAFEVDEVRAPLDWASVVVRGAFYRLDPGAVAEREREAAARAVELLQRVVPNTLGADDPVPSRRVLFRIHVDDVTGRRAVPGG